MSLYLRVIWVKNTKILARDLDNFCTVAAIVSTTELEAWAIRGSS